MLHPNIILQYNALGFQSKIPMCSKLEIPTSLSFFSPIANSLRDIPRIAISLFEIQKMRFMRFLQRSDKHDRETTYGYPSCEITHALLCNGVDDGEMSTFLNANLPRIVPCGGTRVQLVGTDSRRILIVIPHWNMSQGHIAHAHHAVHHHVPGIKCPETLLLQ